MLCPFRASHLGGHYVSRALLWTVFLLRFQRCYPLLFNPFRVVSLFVHPDPTGFTRGYSR